MTASTEEVIDKIPLTAEPSLHCVRANTATIAAEKTSSDSSLLINKFIPHQPNSGLNPLVDAAAYLFSIIGKLKLLKAYRHLVKLQKELIHEIDSFQTTLRSHGYSSEYILVSRYAVCATLDDVISNTAWGGQGQWDDHAIQAVFNQDGMTHDRFFVILERIIKDPAQYIELMELMYLCLSLGFKGNYRNTEFGSNQLELITNALYKRIRAYRGSFNKALAPYPLKINPRLVKPNNQGRSVWLISIATIIAIAVIFISLGYMLDTISNQAYQALIQIGNSMLYETIHS